MRHQALIEGAPVCLRDPTGLDEHGVPWRFGIGPFVVARVYTTRGYREPWFRLMPPHGRGPLTERELPGSFRAKELRHPTTGELCSTGLASQLTR